jgi:MFS family permease
LSVFVIGGLLATIPVTHFADRFGKLKILLISVCILIFSILFLSLADNSITTQIFAFTTGASLTPVFPLALALIGDKLSYDELSAGSALFTAVYSFGCTAGPLLSSVTMQIFDNRYIFSLILIIFILFMLILLQKLPKIKST